MNTLPPTPQSAIISVPVRTPKRKLLGDSNGNGCHPQDADPDPHTQPIPSHEESVAVFMERDPAGYAKIVEFVEQGHSPAGVAALARVPLATVRKIRNLLGESAIHAGIRQVARNLVEASQNMSERLVNESAEIPIQLLPNALGTVIDRASLLSGGVTARAEHRRKDVPTPEQLQELFNALPKAKAIDVQHELVPLERPHQS